MIQDSDSVQKIENAHTPSVLKFLDKPWFSCPTFDHPSYLKNNEKKLHIGWTVKVGHGKLPFFETEGEFGS